jgi:predicted metal-dependent phosphoesterase TrpH
MIESTGTRVDPHVKILDSEVVRRAKAEDIDMLVYAPHFTNIETIRHRAEFHSDDELLVVPAREYFTGTWNERRHVLAIDPEEPIPDFISLEDTMAELERQDPAILAPHPEFLSVSLSREDILEYSDQIHAVEAYCPKHWGYHNERAEEIAEGAGLSRYGSSYAHLYFTLGEVFVEFEEDLETVEDLSDAIKRGAPRKIVHEDGLLHQAKCKVEFFHLTWENTYDKFMRVVVKGTEETNPFYPVYDERFHEMSAY